jgi:hypothetical protein
MNAWKPEEEELLRLEWPKQGIKCAELFPRHSRNGVLARAYLLGLRFKTNNLWLDKPRPSRSCGSGQIAGPTFRGLLCRERLGL